MDIYTIFGLTLAGNHSLGLSRAAPGADPDLALNVNLRPARNGVPDRSPDWVSSYSTGSGQARFELFAGEDDDVLHYDGLACFRVGDDRIEVFMEEERVGDLRPLLLGTVLPFSLERRGIPVLHASCLAFDGRATAFLGPGGVGKSTLALALLQAGWEFLADDSVAVDPSSPPLARPSYPEIRVLPRQLDDLPGVVRASARRIHPTAEKLTVPVGPGSLGRFAAEPLPLTRVYLLERLAIATDEYRPVITAVPAAESVVRLAKGSPIAPLLDGLDMHHERLSRIIRIAANVPVRRLAFAPASDGPSTLTAAITGDVKKKGSRVLRSTRSQTSS